MTLFRDTGAGLDAGQTGDCTMTETLTLTLTEEEVINLWNAVRSQLVDARRAVREGGGSDELVARLEVLYERLQAMCLEFANPQKVGA